MTLRTLGLCLFASACLFLAGCEIPAQTYWSPDGLRAAYLPADPDKSPALVIDDRGATVAKLAKTTGGFAWSKDSKRLYFASIDPKTETIPPFEVRRKWLNIEEERALPKKDEEEADKDKPEVAINVWEEGKITPLFVVGDEVPWYMAISPDEKWLALVTINTQHDGVSRLYVFSLSSKRLYPVSIGCARSVCFTGPNRMAFVEPNRVSDGKASDVGVLTEAMLSDESETLERQSLVLVLMPVTPWIQAVGEDILLSTFSFTFPGRVPEVDPEENSVYGLHRYVRADRSLKRVADEVGPLFTPSPDGQLVMLEKILNPADKENRQSKLAVMELANGAVHVVADGTMTFADASGARRSGIPAYPAWRSQREISFVSPINPSKPIAEQENRYYMDLALYELTADYQLKQLRILSEHWPLEIKPSFKGK